MLKSDVDCIERAYKEATLAADRAAVDVLVKLEGIDVEEEYYSPRERQSTDKARGTRASLIKTTRFAKDGGDQPQRNQKRRSISAPPTNRRSCAEGSTGAPSTTKPIPLWRKSSSGRILSGGDKGGSQSSAPATLQRRTSSFKMRNLKKLEEKIQGALASRVNKMADRSEKVGEVREKVKEAARAAPIVKTLKDGSMTQRGGGVTNRGGPTTSRGVPAITSRVGSSKQLTSRVGSPKPLRKRTSLERIFCGGSGKALTEAPPPPPQAKPGTALPAPGRLPPPSASFAPAQQSCLKRRAADGGGQSTSTPVPPLSGMPAPAPMPPPRTVVSPERRTTQTVGSAVAARQSAAHVMRTLQTQRGRPGGGGGGTARQPRAARSPGILRQPSLKMTARFAEDDNDDEQQPPSPPIEPERRLGARSKSSRVCLALPIAEPFDRNSSSAGGARQFPLSLWERRLQCRPLLWEPRLPRPLRSARPRRRRYEALREKRLRRLAEESRAARRCERSGWEE